MNYAKITLKQGREKSVVAFHPWVYSGAIESADPTLKTGDVTDVYSAKGLFLGRGFYHESSSIAVRIMTFDEEAIDEHFFRERIENARIYREQLHLNTTAMRVVNASGDFLPGLIVDQFDTFLVVQMLSAGLYRCKDVITDVLRDIFRPQGIFNKSHAAMKDEENLDVENEVLYGDMPPEKIYIHEDDFLYPVPVLAGQKTGFYLDLRGVRHHLKQMAEGKSILNLFSYTGSLSMLSLMSGAEKVVSVDSSQQFLDILNYELERKFLDDHHTSVCKNAFEYLREDTDLYDIIVVDPPPLCRKKSHVTRASRAYKDVNIHALRQVKPGGFVFTMCCSHHVSTDLFRKIIFGAAKDAERNVRIARHIAQEPDHPINIYHPETEYFKGFLLAVD